MTTKKLTYMAVLIALSVVLANVKLMGSIALDAMPAFFAAIFISPMAGGIIGLIGHIVSSMLSGFPFTPMIHIAIAMMMFITVYIFGKMYKQVPVYISVAVAILLNGVVSTYITFYIMGMNSGGINTVMMYSVMQVLVVASAINVILAVVVERMLSRRGYEKL